MDENRDGQLLALFHARDEQALAAVNEKYGRTLCGIAFSLLNDRQDAEEIVSDVLMTAWNSIPPDHPCNLLGYLAAVTRNLSMHRLDARTAQRRGGGQRPAVLDELRECAEAPDTVEAEIDRRMLADALNRFLRGLPEQSCDLFVLRYTYAMPVQEIAKRQHLSVSAVKISLYRTRKKLRTYLEQEGLL